MGGRRLFIFSSLWRQLRKLFKKLILVKYLQKYNVLNVKMAGKKTTRKLWNGRGHAPFLPLLIY